jgi:hypothetical protein
MKVNIFDFPVGSSRASTDTSLDAQLGSLATQGSKVYRLVKAAAAIATPSGKAVASARSSGTKTWSVNIPATTQLAVDGVIPSDYGSTTIASGAYFWIQVSGVVNALAATTTIVGDSTTLSLVYANTSAQVAPFTAGTDAVLVGNAALGSVLNTAAVTAAGDTVYVQLSGLI